MLNGRQTTKGLKNPIMTIATFAMLMLALNPDWGGVALLWWACVAVFLLVFLVTQKELFINSGYVIWSIAFLGYCVASYFWAVSWWLVLSALKTMIVHTLLLLVLNSIMRTKEDVERLLKIIVVVCIVNAVYLIINNVDVVFGESTGTRLGTEGDWNANGIGMMMSFASIVLIYLMRGQKGKMSRTLSLILIIFLVFVSFITGSRKAFLMVLLGISTFLMFTAHKNKKITTFLIVVVAFIGIYYMVMTEPFLYSVLGWRLEGLISSITGVGTIDASAENRELYIKAGIQVFGDNFWVGCGLDCFRVLNSKITGDSMYAHNNYVELLADLGIVGAAIYYSIYFVIFSRLIKNYKKGEGLTKLLLVLMLLLILVDYGSVSYNSILFNILILFSFSWTKILKKGEYQNGEN